MVDYKLTLTDIAQQLKNTDKRMSLWQIIPLFWRGARRVGWS